VIGQVFCDNYGRDIIKRTAEPKVRIICGNSNSPLGEAISHILKVPICDTEIRRFSDGEIFVQINENIRGADIFVIQSTNPPTDNIFELLMLIEACKRASAETVTAVIPYYGYGRADRKDRPRVCITARLLADLLTVAGCDRIITMDLHAAQIQGFFKIPVDHLYSSLMFNGYLQKLPLNDLAVVSPDLGSIKVARSFASIMQASLAIIDKRRPTQNKAEVVNIIGDVKGHDLIIRDDMVDTAGTLCEAAVALAEKGAGKIYACATHGVLSGRAVERLEEAPIAKIIISDTIDNNHRNLPDKFVIISCARVFAEAIGRVESGESVSSLFDGAEEDTTNGG
jgi:ribose-phosphate pyrophosphokinase